MTLFFALLGAPAQGSARETPAVLAVETSAPSVIAIHCKTTRANPLSLRGRTYDAASEGSGVVIDASGLVLTNAHVVSGASEITVQLGDGKRWPARLLGLEAELDIAVLQVDGAPLPPIPLGTSADLRLGETVIAIGNPYGLGQSISLGVISQSLRELEMTAGVSQGYIQTDAAINPGNSGGALINLDGQLIGINTAAMRDAENIGFAIPVDRALKVAWDLSSYGAVSAPWLGFDVKDVYRRQLAGTPLAAGAVVVTRVFEGGPAAAAGLTAGAVVYQIDGRGVRSRADLNAYLASLRPGEDVRLSFIQGGRALDASLATTAVPAELGARVLSEVLGVSVEAGTNGAVVRSVEAGGAWARARLKSGDVILAINGQPVADAASLEQALTRAKAGHRPTAAFTIGRGRHRATLSLPIG